MSVKITYFVHGATTDNEQGISSGWSNPELSVLGKKQSAELRKIIRNEVFHVVFCSDLKRAVDSAKIVFGERKIPIVRDRRLRECNYGDLNGAPSEMVEPAASNQIETPFPDGESYRDVEARTRSFLKELSDKYRGKHVAIVSHRGPQLALEVILKGETWEYAFAEDWRVKKPKAWRPGWDYILENWNKI
jgi:alpha-ribazole phosphatase/probable phosphoglycerate mutase